MVWIIINPVLQMRRWRRREVKLPEVTTRKWQSLALNLVSLTPIYKEEDKDIQLQMPFSHPRAGVW